MLPNTKRRFVKAAIWATILTGVGSACWFLPPLLKLPDTLKMGGGLLMPGFFVDMLIGNAHDLDRFMYLVPPFTWLIYFWLFYGTFGAFGSTKVNKQRPSV
jgi:hypothetical protein